MKNKQQKKEPLKCHVCGERATHAVMIELRDKPGPPLKENNVIRTACDAHSTDKSFDYWVPHHAFISLCNTWRKETNIILRKEYCTINIVKFK